MTSAEKIYAKLYRAKEHIAELERILRTFLDSSPYEVTINHNYATRKMEWILVRDTPVPPNVSTVAGDAIQNLRSTLDHLAWQLVLSNNQTPTNITGFPIAASLQEYTSRKVRRKVEGMQPDVIAAIDRLRPYSDGNALLWRLHSLNNRDKHRLLLSAASAVTLHHLLPSQREELARIYRGSDPSATDTPDLRGSFIRPTAAPFPAEVGKVCLAIPEAEMENDFTFRMGIAFNEAGIAEGEPVLQTVQQFFDLVTQIIASFVPML